MTAVTTASATVRPGLADQLRALPDEAFTRLQYLTPATGCFNRCAFCSQQAGRDIWQLTAAGLTAVANAMAEVAASRGLRIASGRIHRPGVLFPYLDNDIASYPHFETFCRLARDVLHVRLRVSTVGYSSRNPQLVAMHRRIARDYKTVFDGIRLSVTPYTIGWAGRASEPASRAQFTADLANMLATYRTVFDALGHGPATAAAELRFAPLLGLAELTDTTVDGRHVLACGPHLLISAAQHDRPLPLTAVERLDEHTQPVLSTPGRSYLHLAGDQLTPHPATIRAALTGNLNVPHQARTVTVFRFANADGGYYAADPGFHPDGRFTALHLYPATHTRRRSGYTDATRWFLNTLLHHKADRGLTRRVPFPRATNADVTAVLARLNATARGLAAGINSAAATHLRTVVIPLVTGYADALRRAGYPAAAFFSRDFTIDTGQIVNQGRAMGLFRRPGFAGLPAPDHPDQGVDVRHVGRIFRSGAKFLSHLPDSPAMSLAQFAYPAARRAPRIGTGADRFDGRDARPRSDKLTGGRAEQSAGGRWPAGSASGMVIAWPGWPLRRGARPSTDRAESGMLSPSAMRSVRSREVTLIWPFMIRLTLSCGMLVLAAILFWRTPYFRARWKSAWKSRARKARTVPGARQASSGMRIGSKTGLGTAGRPLDQALLSDQAYATGMFHGAVRTRARLARVCT